MSRVVNTNSPGKRRNHHMRSCAELLRHLSQKAEMDDEARDMVAALVVSLRGIDSTIDEAVEAWEKRGYWIKTEQFRHEWVWVGMAGDELAALLRQNDWEKIITAMTKLLPHFASMNINKLMRKPDLWEGEYARFIGEGGEA